MTNKLNKYFVMAAMVVFSAGHLTAQEISIPLNPNGFVGVWNVAGPFEQPPLGFSDAGDKEIIEEISDQNHLLNADGLDIDWIPKLIDSKKFLDINNVIGKAVDSSPSRIIDIKAGYAFAVLNSKTNQKVKALFGGNSISKVIVNGDMVHSANQSKNAVKDEAEIVINLREGDNYILLKLFNSQKNYSLAFFSWINYEWGFYFRLVDENRAGLKNIEQIIDEPKLENDFELTPTFFIKEMDGELKQKLYLDVVSKSLSPVDAEFKIDLNGAVVSKKINAVYGHNNYEMFIPVIQENKTASLKLVVEGIEVQKEINFTPPKRYELHLMLLSHMDIGYTNPQPVVKEKQIKTLEDVVALAKKDPRFKWTIETVWQLEQYREAKSDEEFGELIELIKSGRIALSPLYANPFTGWISEEEGIESFTLAAELKNKYGLEYNAVVYNDVPGESQFIPQLLSSAGIHFLSNGINEIYNDYAFQRNLPKAFLWQGSDSSQIINYVHESYVEGMYYGLERNADVTESRTWQRINKLQNRGYDYELVLLDAAFTDNAGIATTQYNNALKWNEEYAYPKFVISNLDQFAEEFKERYAQKLPVIKGDYTSTWDILSQGEAERNINMRWVQNNSVSAAKLNGALWLADDNYVYPSALYGRIFNNLLLFSGHGSGMEYGFGNSYDNYITDAYRGQYIDNAVMDTHEFIMRSHYLLTKPMESLEVFGINIFNPLSWQRDEIVSVEFKASEDRKYSVIDISTGNKLDSYYESPLLTFHAVDLPAMGYKNYKLVGDDTAEDVNRLISGNIIENNYYKIEIDRTASFIKSIYDKELEVELITGDEFNVFDVTKDLFGSSQNVGLIETGYAKLEIKSNDLFQTIAVRNKYALVPLLEVKLYNGLKYIDVKMEFDLRELSNTELTEYFNLMMPFVSPDSEIYFDLLGGEYDYKLRPDWIGHNSYSIRDYVRIENRDHEIVIASPDARVLSLDKSDDGLPIIMKVNLANNFPLHWNRNEKNDSKLEFNFRITSNSLKTKDISAFKFGVEKNMPSFVKKSWFNKSSIFGRFVELNNDNVILKNIRPSGDKIVMVLKNISDYDQAVVVSSKYFANKNFSLLNIWGERTEEVIHQKPGAVELSLKPGEIKYLEISRK